MLNNKKIIYSGMQPTGTPSLANYLGAIKNWVDLQDEDYCSIFAIVDLHALTIRHADGDLQRRVKSLYTLFLASGLDPEKSIIYCQSQVPAHAELAWILECYTYMGELSRMTQFKAKSQKNEDNINAGLFTYPVLMAADVLLYQTDLVPVGVDQLQHLELARDVAERFNGLYGNVFTVPEAYMGKIGAKVMSLQDPTKKMSKTESDNVNNVIYMLDEPDVITKKFKRALTDSENTVKFSESQPAVSNLLEIYSAASQTSISEAESFFDGKGYGFFKQAVAESVIELLKPVRERYADLSKNPDYVDALMKNGANRATELAGLTLAKAKESVGLLVL
ncbi:tryptophan--tRNA ligase [Clostridia bacterium]|nr:tryptophan--tRNA ligase [Clostridia bacterium]